MRQRPLGNTGLDVPLLSYGASSLGSVFRSIDEGEGIRTVHEAFDLGMRYFDVSPYYGATKAETVLGRAIASLPRDSFVLSTKAGRYGMDTFDFSGARIRKSLEESCMRLGTDYVDILFLHDIEFVPLRIIIEESIPTLEALKREGKIRYGGVSGLPLDIFKQTLSRAHVDVILSYCHYSLNDTSLIELLPLLKKSDTAVVNASPLSMGLLNDRPAADWHPAGKDIQEACKRAAAFCKQEGSDLAKLAVQFSVMDERIPTTLVSTASIENLRNNARWIEEPIDMELLGRVLEILEPIHNATWASGRPEYNMGIMPQREGDIA